MAKKGHISDRLEFLERGILGGYIVKVWRVPPSTFKLIQEQAEDFDEYKEWVELPNVTWGDSLCVLDTPDFLQQRLRWTCIAPSPIYWQYIMEVQSIESKEILTTLLTQINDSDKVL